MDVSDVKRLRELERENNELKKPEKSPERKARTGTSIPNPITLSNFRLKAPTLGATGAELSRRL